LIVAIRPYDCTGVRMNENKKCNKRKKKGNWQSLLVHVMEVIKP
jgi:hypothetical protein